MQIEQRLIQVGSLTLLVSAAVFGSTAAMAQAADRATTGAAAMSKQDRVAALKSITRSGPGLNPNDLGEFSRDNVYTAVTPCRIVDTRNTTAISGGTTRQFDVDGTNFSAQGGFAGACGIPLGVAASVAMTITVTGTSGASGFLTAWGLGTQPLSSVINWNGPNLNIANTTIVPVVPGAGNDFSVFASSTTHVVIDVVGFFAAPEATPLDCTNVASAVTTVPNNVYTNIDAFCPAGRTPTGGGTFPTEGTLGRPGIWTDGSPISGGWRTWVNNQTGSNRTSQTYVVCCRVPGR
jgi:hypothetical protein